MHGVDFEQRNDYLGKPENNSNHQVYALPICRVITEIPGVIPTAPPVPTLAHISCWELTDDELQEVIRTKRVYLRVLGATTYPLSLHGRFPGYDTPLTEEQIKILKGEQ